MDAKVAERFLAEGGGAVGNPALRRNGDENFGLTEWAPLVDVTEDEKEFLIKAELPEMKKEDVKVTIEEGTLRITGERKLEKEEKGKICLSR